MSCVFSDHIPNHIPFLPRALVYSIHLVRATLSHEPREKVVYVVWVEF